MADIRVINTTNRIKEGFIKTLQEKPFSKITTSEIIDRTQISRRTFYLYYTDKNELLQVIEAEMIEGLKKAMVEDRKVLERLMDSNGPVPTSEEVLELADEAFYNTVEFCVQHKETLRTLLSEHGDIKFMRMITKTSYDEFVGRTSYLFKMSKLKEVKKSQADEVPMDYIATIYAGGIASLIMYWISTKDSIAPRSLRHIIGLYQVKAPFEIMANIDQYEN